MQTQELLRRMVVDVFRVLILLAFVLLVSQIDAWLNLSTQFAFFYAVLTSSSIILLIAGFSHIVRRILFPYVDLRLYAAKAMETPMGAALVFLSCCMVIVSFTIINAMLLS